MGDFNMAGDLENTVTLNLTLAGEIESDGSGGIRRTVGTTTVSGTATSSYGTFDVDVTL
jgi:hypothetical protein